MFGTHLTASQTSRIISLFWFLDINNFYRNFSVAIYFGSFENYRLDHLSSNSLSPAIAERVGVNVMSVFNLVTSFGAFQFAYIHKIQSKIQFVPKTTKFNWRSFNFGTSKTRDASMVKRPTVAQHENYFIADKINASSLFVWTGRSRFRFDFRERCVHLHVCLRVWNEK